MLKEILLIFPKLDEYKDYHYIPYSSLSVAAPLERFNINYNIYDERVEEESKLAELSQKAGIIGITMFTGYQTFRAFNILKKIKSVNPDIITVAGGPHATELPIEILNSEYVDYVVSGFGEAPFYKLACQLLRGVSPDKISVPGVYGKKDVSRGRDISSERFDHNYWFPLPFHKINIENYVNPATKRGIYLTQYGCVGECTFCATQHTRKFAQKPLDLIKTDVQNLLNRYPFEQLWFADATLLTNKKRFFELKERLNTIDKFNNVTLRFDARANELAGYTDEELAEIKNIGAGISGITVGLESGSINVIENIMKKGKNYLENFKLAIDKCRNAGIRVMSGLIFGMPGETSEDIKKTIEFIRRIREADADFRLSTTFFRPLPGTELFAKLKEPGFVRDYTLEEWAKLSLSTHYEYNKEMEIPWMDESERKKYKKLYKQFISEHGEILV